MLYNIPSRKELLREAIIKRENNYCNYVKEVLPDMSLEDSVLLLYTDCTPSVYGKLFEERLYLQLKRHGLYIEQTNKKEERGDVSLYYPQKTQNVPNKHYGGTHDLITDIVETEGNITTHSVQIGKLNLFKRNYEIKFSFLGKNLCYSVRNIRYYHDFDYFILVFVDIYDDFKINYFCIKKNDMDSFNLSHMNGTYDSNKNNENINYGTTIKHGGFDYRLLQHMNLLDGTSFNDLLKFMIEDNLKLRKEIFKMLSTKGLKFSDGSKVKYKIRKLNEVNPEKRLTETLNELNKLKK